MRDKPKQQIEVTFEKLVHGGEALGFSNGPAAGVMRQKAIFAFNALPGETAIVELTKDKKDFASGVAIEILKKSNDRIEPVDSTFLINSPWQILKYDRELFYKKEILKETFAKLGKIELPEFEIKTDGQEYNYRNKMEFNFCDDQGQVALAFYERGTHHKVPTNGSILADEKINSAGQQIVDELNNLNIDARRLKTLILRSDNAKVIAALFVKDELYLDFEIQSPLVGIEVYFSNPKSPASTPDKLLCKKGQTTLEQQLVGRDFEYNALSFFQVNIPIYEMALKRIAESTFHDKKIVDMYCGVGSIGIATNNKQPLVGIDSETTNIGFAIKNAEKNNIKASFFSTPDFCAIEHVPNDATLILDPPRAGIHKTMLTAILEKLPPKIIYLSCNPSTQARDMELLKQHYKLTFFEAYNFFPRTPHIESLAVLTR
ncbi:MAG: hypothetical protein V1902_02195 [Candidatus Falkowbacteria bacterium]